MKLELAIINKYYTKDSKSYNILIGHSLAVMNKAVKITENCGINNDLNFIKEACILHDIGIFATQAPEIGCFGDKPYICHGYVGRQILEIEGLFKHALVCERHSGAGISISEITNNKLPLPERDMIPITIEEIIICVADKFYSKLKKNLSDEKSLEEIYLDLAKFGREKIDLFNYWLSKLKLV